MAIEDPRTFASFDDAWERAAFHELHGRSLHGFALLMTLGDREASAQATGESIDAGMDRLDDLRHPERAAAWLRSDLLSRLGRHAVATPDARASGLTDLAIEPAVLAGLSALSRRERASLISADIEQLDPRDVAVVVGRSGSRLDRLLVRGRRRYLTAYLASAPDIAPGGPLADHVATTARRALG